ncbi:MAG TPA: alpha/beta hydrolase [Acidimicrobiia bacterium]|nr:alpha/beta hydrolase [Acidimicrobiia bacterium]
MPTTTAADGTAVAYEVDGSGPVLLFVHGITEDHTMWDPIVERLRAGFTCARLDLRGHGRSAAAADYDSSSTVGDLAATVAAVAAPDPPTIIGHSLGGFLATIYAVTGAGPVRAVVNVDQSLRLADLAQVVRPLEADLRGPAFEDVLGAILDSLGTDRLDPGTQKRLHEFHGQARQEFVLGAWQAIFDSTDEEIEALVESMLPNLRVPYLALHGADPGPGYSDWLTSLVPTATVEVWEGHGHWLHLVDPDRFVARIRDFAAAT